MSVERECHGGLGPTMDFKICNFPIKILVKNAFLLVSLWQNEISPLLAPCRMSFAHIMENFTNAPPRKTPSNTQVCSYWGFRE